MMLYSNTRGESVKTSLLKRAGFVCAFVYVLSGMSSMLQAVQVQPVNQRDERIKEATNKLGESILKDIKIISKKTSNGASAVKEVFKKSTGNTVFSDMNIWSNNGFGCDYTLDQTITYFFNYINNPKATNAMNTLISKLAAHKNVGYEIAYKLLLNVHSGLLDMLLSDKFQLNNDERQELEENVRQELVATMVNGVVEHAVEQEQVREQEQARQEVVAIMINGVVDNAIEQEQVREHQQAQRAEQVRKNNWRKSFVGRCLLASGAVVLAFVSINNGMVSKDTGTYMPRTCDVMEAHNSTTLAQTEICQMRSLITTDNTVAPIKVEPKPKSFANRVLCSAQYLGFTSPNC